jgi:hypothetical protein
VGLHPHLVGVDHHGPQADPCELAEVNAVKRLLRAAGLGHLSKSLGTEAAWTKLLAALAPEAALRTHVAQHHALWRCAQAQIVALESRAMASAANYRGHGPDQTPPVDSPPSWTDVRRSLAFRKEPTLRRACRSSSTRRAFAELPELG